jgi:predicted phage terminase large subunit-like protein
MFGALRDAAKMPLNVEQRIHSNRRTLTAEDIEGFTRFFLLDTYADPAPIPPVHRSWWQDVCSSHRRVVIAAPRSHAKSTALNHAYGLAASLFKVHPFQIKISRTYDLAVEKLRQAKEELQNNERLKTVFQLKTFERDTENDFIAVMSDGYRFRMRALGMEQAVRGLSWGTQRPSLFNGDDIEDDEQVLNLNARDKGERWVLRTLLPAGAQDSIVRIYGTILHNDSVLVRLIKNKQWMGKVYEACDADVTPKSILWPEKFSKKDLIEIKENFIAAGDLIGFNMEYRNRAIDTTSGYFRSEEFRPMKDEDRTLIDEKRLTYYASVDFGTEGKRTNHTAMVVAGVDSNGFLYIVDVLKGRWDAKQIIDQMIATEKAWHPQEWFVENGMIWKTMRSALEVSMREEHTFLAITSFVPVNSKQARAKPIQARMRGRSVKFDKETGWYAGLQAEMLEFDRGECDDQVDAMALIGIGLERMSTPLAAADQDDIDVELEKRETLSVGFQGRCAVTGY